MSDPAAGAAAPITFELVTSLAVGASTKVDLCRLLGPVDLGRLVVIKRPRTRLVAEDGSLPRFLHGAESAARLAHPNVVRVLGWGQDDQGPYVCVELVEGISLRRLMKTVFETGEIFTERLVVYVGTLICAGLAAAHELPPDSGGRAGLVHGDFGAGKVLVGFQGEVKIADFGLSQTRRPEAPAMSTRRDDVIALGAVLFELLGAAEPWDPPSAAEPERRAAPTRDLRELRPKLDKRLLSMVERCMERPPAASETARGVGAELEAWLDAHGYRDNTEALARFVRRNSVRQMRWFERATAGVVVPSNRPSLPDPEPPTGPGRMLIADPRSSAATLVGKRDVAHFFSDPESVPLLDDDRAPTRELVPARDRAPLAPSQPPPSEPAPQSGSEDTYVDDGAPPERIESQAPPPAAIEEEPSTMALRRAAPPKAPATSPPPAPARPAPSQRVAQRPVRPFRPAPAAAPPDVTPELLEAEAKRLQALATVKAEEAKVAATQARAANERAQLAAGMARKANEAAAVARDAINIARKVGMVEAARRLERARALEASLDPDRPKRPGG